GKNSKVQFDYINVRFEASRGLFWDGPPHFEPRLDDKDDIRAGNPLSKLPHHTSGRTFVSLRLSTQIVKYWTGYKTQGHKAAFCLPKYDLTCNRPNTRRIFSGIGFRTRSPPAQRPTPYH
ncbi:hypothetical protein AVEN_111400-1, partial [Araneus ventricosus]